MSGSITVMATFEGGVLYPDKPLALAPHQRVSLIVQVQEAARAWRPCGKPSYGRSPRARRAVTSSTTGIKSAAESIR